MPAAEARAWPPSAQGKFWEMHDKLFANQQALDRADLEKYAKEIGLDMSPSSRPLDSRQVRGRRSRPTGRLATKVGAHGTPAFFINGKLARRRAAVRAFKAKIDEEIKKADALVKKGKPKAKLYDEIMKHAQAEAAAAAPPPPPRPPASDDGLQGRPGQRAGEGPEERAGHHRRVLGLPVPVLQRASSRRSSSSRRSTRARSASSWKNYPLPFHPNAKPAAEAAMAADEQGKFWEMHDKLFANQQALDRAALEKYAQESASTWPSSRPRSTAASSGSAIEPTCRTATASA